MNCFDESLRIPHVDRCPAAVIALIGPVAERGLRWRWEWVAMPDSTRRHAIDAVVRDVLATADRLETLPSWEVVAAALMGTWERHRVEAGHPELPPIEVQRPRRAGV
jgi:hypothetical protein